MSILQGSKLRRWTKRTWIFAVLGLFGALALGSGAYAALGGSVPQSTSGDVELQRGLAGWWKLDGNAYDSTPNANNGTVNGPTAAADRRGAASKAYAFAGSGTNNINLGNQPAYNSPDWTVAAWVNPTSWGPNRTIVDKNQQYRVRFDAFGNLNVLVDTTGVATSEFNGNIATSGNFTLNTWQHVVVTISSTNNTIKAYANGVEVGSAAWNSDITAYNTNPMLIGSSSTGGADRFLGSMDDIRIYNRAINANEAKALADQYDAGVYAATSEINLIAHWKMDGNGKDSTPYGNNSTLNNVTAVADRKGRANAAYSFDGTSSYITLPFSSDFNTGGPYLARMVTMWFKATGTTNRQVLFEEGGSTRGLNIYILSGRIYVNGWNTVNDGAGTPWGPLNVSTPVSSGVWHQVVLVDKQTAGTLTGYLDGVSFGQVSGVGPLFAHTDTACLGNACLFTLYHDIGSSSSNAFFAGSMDDVRIYNVAASAPRLNTLYQSYDAQINLNSSPTTNTTGGNINQGLVGYWPLNGNAKDATPYSDNGTVTGATLTTDRKGRANSAYAFTGSPQQITASASSLPTGLHPQTLVAWVKPTDFTAGRTVFRLYNSSTGDEIRLRLTTLGRIQIGNQSTGGIYTSPAAQTLTAGTWNLVAWTWDGTNSRLYLNDIPDTTPNNGAIQASDLTFNSVSIGGAGIAGQFFVGSIDDARVYNRALSPAEIQSLYASPN